MSPKYVQLHNRLSVRRELGTRRFLRLNDSMGERREHLRLVKGEIGVPRDGTTLERGCFPGASTRELVCTAIAWRRWFVVKIVPVKGPTVLLTGGREGQRAPYGTGACLILWITASPPSTGGASTNQHNVRISTVQRRAQRDRYK